MLLLSVGVISAVVLQILEEQTVWLRDEEHELVEHLSDNVFPVLLVPLLFEFLLLRVLDAATQQSLILALLSMLGETGLHRRDVGDI